MSIKDKRKAVVEAAKHLRHGRRGVGQLHDAVDALEEAETPIKLEGEIRTASPGHVEGAPNVELRGHLVVGSRRSEVTVYIQCDAVVTAFRRSSGSHRFRLVLTEIMDEDEG